MEQLHYFLKFMISKVTVQQMSAAGRQEEKDSPLSEKNCLTCKSKL